MIAGPSRVSHPPHHLENHTLSRLDRAVVQYTEWLIRNRVVVLLALIIGTAAIAAQLRNAVFNADYAVFFTTDDPKVRQYGEVLQAYTNNASVFFVVTAQNGDVFSEETLRAVEYITEEAWSLNKVVRVDSLTNFQYARWEEDGFKISSLIDTGEFSDPQRLEEARAAATGQSHARESTHQ